MKMEKTADATRPCLLRRVVPHRAGGQGRTGPQRHVCTADKHVSMYTHTLCTYAIGYAHMHI
eukprot:scaffold2041_cov110-Isochrysis_galbana.AAC.4